MLYKAILKGLDAVDIRLIAILLLVSGVFAGRGVIPVAVEAVWANWQIDPHVSGAAPAQAVQTDETEEAKRDKFIRTRKKIPNRYIVVLEDRAAGPRGENSNAENVANDLAAEFSGRVDRVYKHAINGFAAEMTEERAIAMSRDPRVQYIEEDSEISLNTTQPNATWGLDRIDQRGLPLDTNYNYNQTGAGVRAYIIDSGIRTTHTDFGGRSSVGFDAFGQSGQDCFGHGTHVAGTVGGTTWGVAKGVSLVGVRVFDCFGEGSTSLTIAGVDWVTNNATDPAVVNMSLGYEAYDAGAALDTAVKNSINTGLTYVIAAGNSNKDACDISPARVGPAISVGASDMTDARAGFSNFGMCVDLFGPGVGITSAWHTSDTATQAQQGTSMAAPHVAGAAALYLQANPGATPAQVRAFLVNEATKNIVTSSNSTNNQLLFTFWGATPIVPVNVPPSASFTFDCSAGQTCTFDGTGSTDADGTVVAYHWNFGDGFTAEGANVQHAFNLIGNHFVTLTVADNGGEASLPETKTIPIVNTPVGTNVTVNEQSGFAKITFNAVTVAGNTRLDFFNPQFIPTSGNTICTSCSAYSITTTATWNALAIVSLDVPAIIDEQTFNSMSLLRYPFPNFDVAPINITTGRVTNPDGTREIIGQTNGLGTFALATQVAQQPNTAPTLNNLSAPQINENGIATLSGNINDPNAADTFTFTVNWGDGSAPQIFNYAAGTTTFSETHRYLDNAAAGSYTINMTIADSAGGSSTNALFVTVNNVAPTLSNITANPSTILTGGSTTVSGNISDPGTLDSVTVTIDWRDPLGGSTVLDLPAGTTSFSAQHQYSTAGTYILNVNVRDKDNAATVVNPAATVIVNNAPPPDLTNMQITSPISENGAATLSGTLSSQIPNSTFSLAVNWGDGSQVQTFNYQAGTTSFSETHQYLDNGNYPVGVTLTDSSGGSDTGSATVTINNVAPTLSNIQVSPNSIITGGSVNLTGNISDPGSLDSQSITINWGDGSQATTLNSNAGSTSFSSSHLYSQAGSFNISVTATDKDGAQGTGGAAITVVTPPPTPTPTPVPPRVPNLPFTEIGLNGSAFAGLTPGPDGRLYGVTYDGPVSDNEPNDSKLDQGTLFSVDPDMTNRVDHHIFIDQTDGNTPYNELTWVPAEGKFFGATSDGGAEGSGKIFTYDPATDEFAVKPGGFTGAVWGSLALLNGNLYGIVQSSPQECIFRLRPSDFAVTFLHCVDAFGPRLQGLTAGEDGWLYGNSVFGGIACDPDSPGTGCGEIFKIRPWNDGEQFDPQYQVIFQFQFYGGRDYPCPPLDKFCVRFPHTENHPIRQLEYGSDGHLYGTTFYSVFRLDPHAADVTDSFKTLWNDGGGIQATVIEGVDGRLYFTDYGGGTEGVGRVLSMYKNGGGVFELRNFTLLSGSTAFGPNGRLYQDPVSKKIYGTTENTDIAPPFPGTAFAIDIPPAEYRLSGSLDGTLPIVVDDALDIYVNGALMYTDGSAGSGERGPIEIPEGYLKPGDIIRLVARDTHGICQSLSAVYLVDNFGTSTPLVEPGFSNGCEFPPGDNGIFLDRSTTVPGNVNSAPVISSFSAPATLSEHGVAALSFLVSDPDAGDTLTITVNWGDGSPSEEYNTPAGNNIPFNLFHTYLDDNPTGSASDQYLLTVSVSDGPAVDSESQNITVNNLAPFINSVSASPAAITAGQSTAISGTFGDTGTQDSFMVLINWGDGSQPTQLNIGAGSTTFNSDHQYNATGTYTIGVTVRDDDTGESSSTVGVTVNGQPPPNAPTNLVAASGSASRIDLTWADNSTNETGFVVERCKGKATNCRRFTALPTLGANTTSFSDTGLLKGSTYVYRVYAINGFGNSDFSNLASATTARR